MKNAEIIFGAPGCGKTTYLLNLLEKLLEKYSPNEIAYVSFTRKGSYEGRDRAVKRFGFKNSDFPYFRTIHSLAFKELGVSKYDMISKRNYREFSKAVGMNFVGYYTEDFVNNDDKYLFYNSLKRNNIESSKKYENDLDFNKFNFIEHNYAKYKKEIGILDFDDLLLNFVQEGLSVPVKVAIIDEAQDLTSLQWEVCKVAFNECEKVYIAGDDDQAIYEWSGADIEQFLNLKGSRIILDQSWRLKENILNFSKAISNKIVNRVNKDFHSVEEGGGICFYNDLNDLSINSEETYYLLSRNNYFLSRFKTFIMKKGVPFMYKGEPYIKMETFNAIKKYEALRKTDFLEIKRSVLLKKYLHPYYNINTVWYDAFNLPLEELNFYRDIFKYKPDITEHKINISTIHGVKGGEADNVVLFLDVTKNVNEAINRKVSLDSELRCLYVALTRAKKNLHIIYSNSKFGYDEIIKESMNEQSI